MNTPAHIAASLLIWKDETGWRSASAVVIGAVLPDAPMFGFYAWQKLVVRQSENEIWSRLYFHDSWQLFFDVFNSIPLMLLVIAVSHWLGFRWGVLLGASALLHLVCDLPVHHDDAHRHFLPFTNWRFASPVSYWDPRHYGLVFMILELAFAVGACVYVGWKGENIAMRSVAYGTLTLYAAGLIFAAIMWLPQLLRDGSS